MQDNRRNISLQSLARITAGGQRSANRRGSILRKKTRKRSRLLRNT